MPVLCCKNYIFCGVLGTGIKCQDDFSSIQLLSHVQFLATPTDCSTQSITSSRRLLRLLSIESLMPSNHLILCRPLLLLPSVFPSTRVFSDESLLHIRWPSIGISASSLDLPVNIQDGFPLAWTVGSPCSPGDSQESSPHHSSKVSMLWCSAFFIVQLSHLYMTTGKPIALTRWTFVGRVMSLLCNMLSKLVITFVPRSKRLLISWLQSPSAVILEPPKIKPLTFSIVSPSIYHEVMGLDAMILVF